MAETASSTDTARPLAQVEQRPWHRLGERNRFVLYPDRLEVETSWLLSWQRRFYLIGAMPEKPDSIRSRWWTRALATAGITALGTLLTIYVPSRSEGFFWGPTLIVLGVMVGAWSAISFRDIRVLLYGSLPQPNQQVLVPKVILHSGLPSKEAVTVFLTALEKARKLFAERFEQPGVVDGLSDARALERFAELHRKGILTDAEFAEVKAHILGGPKGRAGFGPRRD